jgi:hypothetical protein
MPRRRLRIRRCEAHSLGRGVVDEVHRTDGHRIKSVFGHRGLVGRVPSAAAIAVRPFRRKQRRLIHRPKAALLVVVVVFRPRPAVSFGQNGIAVSEAMEVANAFVPEKIDAIASNIGLEHAPIRIERAPIRIERAPIRKYDVLSARPTTLRDDECSDGVSGMMSVPTEEACCSIPWS